MSETSETCRQMTCVITGNCTCSPVSAGGRLHFDSPAGPTTDPSSPSRAPVHLSARQAQAAGLLMSGTYGRRRSGSSTNSARLSSWESRLRQRLPMDGSILFAMTWKASATPRGRSFFRLRVSGHRTSGSGYGSWRSPNAQNADRGAASAESRLAGGHTLNLQDQVTLAAWPTPNTPSGGRSISIEQMDATGRTADGRKHTASLEHAVKFAAWPTPKESDSDKGVRTADGAAKELDRKGLGADLPTLAASWATPRSTDSKQGNNKTGRSSQAQSDKAGWNNQELARGLISSGSPAETGRPGQLNPAFSLWLMGYPAAWASCGARGIASCHRWRRK